MIDVSKRGATSKAYCIPVGIGLFRAISQTEFDRQVDDETLLDRLSKVDGVFDIEYDGHFGPHLFFSLETQHDTLAKWRQIGKAANAWVAEFVTAPGTDVCHLKSLDA